MGKNKWLQKFKFNFFKLAINMGVKIQGRRDNLSTQIYRVVLWEP